MKLKKFIYQHAAFFSLLVMIVFNLIFQFPYWRQILTQKLDTAVMGNDIDMAEFNMENNFQQFFSDGNLFVVKNKILFPFEFNLALNDPGLTNLIFYAPLRLFLPPHLAVLTTTLISIILSNFLMFLWLKKLNINTPLSFLMSLVFAYAAIPGLMQLGHYTYTAAYIFPLMGLLIKTWLELDDHYNLFLSITLGLVLGLVFLLNFYYLIGLVLAVFIFGALNYSQLLANIPVKKIAYSALLSGSTFLILMFPWLVAAMDSNQTLASPVSLGTVVALSADLLDFITPTKSNPIYQRLLNFKDLNAVQTHVYPGIIILGGMGYLLIKWLKLESNIKHQIKPFFYSTLIWGLFLLGPFLKFTNRWALYLKGVAVIVPLPFLIFHYLPILGGLRAPTRFFPIFLFFAVVSVALILNELMKKLGFAKKYIFLSLLGIIFMFDQFTIPAKLEINPMPHHLYQVIKNDPQDFTVLEIPFTVRDGFQYLGSVNHISFINGALIYKKPVMGGYLARVPSEIFNYYQNLEFMNFILQSIDQGPVATPHQPPKLNPPSLEKIVAELNSLNIKYVILKTNESYSQQLNQLLVSSQFQPQMSDGFYQLYLRD